MSKVAKGFFPLRHHESNSKALFGVSLQKIKKREAALYKMQKQVLTEDIPLTLQMFTTILGSDEAISLEGIFRHSGSEKLKKEYRAVIEKEGSITITKDIDLYSLASLFKEFIREIPEGIVPKAFYSKIVEAKDVQQLKEVICSLPPLHLGCLCHLCVFLVKVASNSVVNKMTIPNLVIIFSPNIFRCPSSDAVKQDLKTAQKFYEESMVLNKPMEWLLNNHLFIFGEHLKLGKQPTEVDQTSSIPILRTQIIRDVGSKEVTVVSNFPEAKSIPIQKETQDGQDDKSSNKSSKDKSWSRRFSSSFKEIIGGVKSGKKGDSSENSSNKMLSLEEFLLAPNSSHRSIPRNDVQEATLKSQLQPNKKVSLSDPVLRLGEKKIQEKKIPLVVKPQHDLKLFDAELITPVSIRLEEPSPTIDKIMTPNVLIRRRSERIQRNIFIEEVKRRRSVSYELEKPNDYDREKNKMIAEKKMERLPVKEEFPCQAAARRIIELREKGKRPYALEKMSRAQLLEEKKCVKKELNKLKALFNDTDTRFHSTKDEKLVMKELYLRYCAIKARLKKSDNSLATQQSNPSQPLDTQPYDSLLLEKRQLQVLLHQYIAKFENEHHRKVKYEVDYTPVWKEYERYKELKTLLKTKRVT